MDGVIERFFQHLTGREWGSLGQVLAADVVRVGPYGDEAIGRDRYLAFLASTVPVDYSNDLLRITYASDDRSGFARVQEHLNYGDSAFHLDEVYSFEIDEAGLLSRIEVYWQTPELDPGWFGSAQSEKSYGSNVD